LPSEYTQDGRYKPRSAIIGPVAEKVDTLNRSKRPAAADVPVWDFAVVEADWDPPRIFWTTKSQLFDCQRELLVLVALAPGKTQCHVEERDRC
jgi:hypothetical protein